MKKDRDCGMQYMGAMPMMPMMPIPNQMSNYQMSNYQMPNYQMPNYQMNNQSNDIINQLNNLEKRISVLENMMNNNNYNNSNYQMM